MMSMVQSYREIFNKKHIEQTGRDLGFVENYWPASSETKLDFFDNYRAMSNLPSAMKERVASSKIVPVPKNALYKVLKHVTQAEHVKYISSKYEVLKRLFTDSRIEGKIRELYGDLTYKNIIKQLDDSSLNKTIELLNNIESVAGRALNNWVLAKIALSPSVFAKQLTSVVNYWEHLDVGEFSKYLAKGFSNPKKTFDFMWENAPFIEARYNRGYSEALRDVIEGADKLSTNKQRAVKILSGMVRSGDILPIIFGGYTVIQSELNKHGNMQKAIDKFEAITIKSQQSGLIAGRVKISTT